jgi:hypothetical protein
MSVNEILQIFFISGQSRGAPEADKKRSFFTSNKFAYSIPFLFDEQNIK